MDLVKGVDGLRDEKEKKTKAEEAVATDPQESIVGKSDSSDKGSGCAVARSAPAQAGPAAPSAAAAVAVAAGASHNEQDKKGEDADDEDSNGEEEDPETLALWPVLLAITSSSSTTTTTTTMKHEAEQQSDESRARAIKRMQKLFTALENASVERLRADRDPISGQSTFDKGRLLVMNAIKAYATPMSTTTARRVACYVHGTLGWRNRHLYTQDREKQQRVQVFADKEALAAIFLDLVKKGALDAQG